LIPNKIDYFLALGHFETIIKSEHLESCHVEVQPVPHLMREDISKSAIVKTFE